MSYCHVTLSYDQGVQTPVPYEAITTNGVYAAPMLPGGYSVKLKEYGPSQNITPGKIVTSVVLNAGTFTVLSIPFIDLSNLMPTVTPTSTPKPVVSTLYPPAGLYTGYDWACQYPLVTGTLPSGVKMGGLCPNGLYSDGTFRNTNAFRTAGGLDWDKMRLYYPDNDLVRLGGVYPVSWKDLNPGEGSYNWALIDDYSSYATKNLVMDTPDGPKPKGVVVKLYNSTSDRPAYQAPVSGIDGGFILDDLTPDWVKSRMIGNVAWGGPTKLTGGQVTKDNGSYWVKMPCVYTDYQASKPQGSNWDYSIWVVPKYNHPAWKTAATRFLKDVSAHYANSDTTFLVGLTGVDGESGNPVQNDFAGCEGIRAAFGNQYGVSTNDLVWPEMIDVWRSGSKTSHAYVSCTSDCDAGWYIDKGVGIFQARAVDDGPNYHRTGDIGVLDWAVEWNKRGLPVAWEAAYTVGTTNYMYEMFSVIAPSYPQWFSIVGGAWANSDMLRYFLSFAGQQVTTTQAVFWKSYVTCFGWPDLIDCQNTTLDTGNWSQYSGWLKNIEFGLTTTATMPLVNPWMQLTATQRTDRRAKMLRSLSGSAIFVPDVKWRAASGNRFVISVEWLDVGVGTAVLSWDTGSVMLERTNGGGFMTHRAFVADKVGSVTLTVTGAPLLLHGVRIEATP